VFDYGQTEPRAAFLAGTPGVYAVEALEDAGQVIRRDARTGVADSYDSGTARSLRADADPATWGRVPQRVVEQVGEDLPQCFGIGIDGRRVGCALERDVAARGALGERTPRFSRGRLYIDPSRFRLPASGFDAREVEQVIDQALHAPRVLHNRLGEPCRLCVRRLSRERLGVSSDGRQRSLQLVRHVRHEIAPDRFES